MSDVDWNTAPLTQLVEHILDEYHLPTRRGLAQLHTMLKRARTRHAATHGAFLDEVLQTYAAVRESLEHHMGREEELLFPLIRERIVVTDGNVLRTLRADHVEERARLDRIDALLQRVDEKTVPPAVGTCMEGLRNLIESVAEHAALEDEILFVRCTQGTAEA